MASLTDIADPLLIEGAVDGRVEAGCDHLGDVACGQQDISRVMTP